MNAAKKLEELLSDPKTRAAFCRAFVSQFPAFAVAMTASPLDRSISVKQARTDHLRLWELIAASGVVFLAPADSELFPRPAQWCGTTSELLELLNSPSSKLTIEQRAELRPAVWLGTQLMELHRQFGSGLVAYRRSGDARRWLLRREVTAMSVR